MIYNYFKVHENAESANPRNQEKMKVQSKCSQNVVINPLKLLLLLNSADNEENAVCYV